MNPTCPRRTPGPARTHNRAWRRDAGPFPLRAAPAFLALGIGCLAGAAAPDPRSDVGAPELAAYFRAETVRLAEACLGEIRTLADWEARRAEYRRELAEMLGLWPEPERTPLRPVVTGRSEHEGFVVERLQFQSLPGLYVTANLYLPRDGAGPWPAILYGCGHGPVVKDGISYGNKVAYHHHGVWFARSGYACLIIDTVQLGEIQGVHHGTYRLGQWWWNSRGYTPAGVEAWNGIRSLDYLSSRPEVDAKRIGMTGRSGGGAYTWFVAALDERVRVAAPVAGITDLQDHVVDGTVEGHCDCMFFVNTRRWDYPQLAALLAPRPLLLANSDKDTIFPLDGVVRVHEHVRRIYELHGAADRLGLLITEGPHKDTQDLQLPVFRWFNRFLKNEDPTIERAAVKLLAPEDLRVLAGVPGDALNTNVQATFVPAAPPALVPSTASAWAGMRDGWLRRLRAETFGGWPAEGGPPGLRPAFSSTRDGVRLRGFDFTSQAHVELRLFAAQLNGSRRARRVVLTILDEPAWEAWITAMRYAFANELNAGRTTPRSDLAQAQDQLLPATDAAGFDRLQERLRTEPALHVWLAPRGVGPTAWGVAEAKRIQIRRRYMLLGQTVDGMRVWDIREAIRALGAWKEASRLPVRLEAAGGMGVNALLAALFVPDGCDLELQALPASFRDGPDYLNVLRILELPQALALAAERGSVRLLHPQPGDWSYPSDVAVRLGWATDRAVRIGE